MDRIRREVLRRLSEWAELRHLDYERGWPTVSGTGLALEVAARACTSHHKARSLKGSAMPRVASTRASGRCFVPHLWGYEPADRMNRLLLDLESEHEHWAEAVRLKAQHPKRSTDDLSQDTGTSGRLFRKHREKGLSWLCMWFAINIDRGQTVAQSVYAADTTQRRFIASNAITADCNLEYPNCKPGQFRPQTQRKVDGPASTTN